MRLVSRLTSGGQRRLSRCLKAAHANGQSSQQPTPGMCRIKSTMNHTANHNKTEDFPPVQLVETKTADRQCFRIGTEEIRKHDALKLLPFKIELRVTIVL